MADPRTPPAAAATKLLAILDALGTEPHIRSLLIGGTVASHLRHLNQTSAPSRR